MMVEGEKAAREMEVARLDELIKSEAEALCQAIRSFEKALEQPVMGWVYRPTLTCGNDTLYVPNQPPDPGPPSPRASPGGAKK